MRTHTRRPSRSKAVKEVHAGLSHLTRGLRMLAREVVREASRAGKVRKTKASPGRRRHGRYIGLIRNLPQRKKAQVRAVRAEKGVEAAIKMAMEMRRTR